MIIDVHGHLAQNPVDLDSIVECGIIKQVWLHDISCYTGGLQVSPASRTELLEISRRYPGFFIPFAFLNFNEPVDEIVRAKESGFVGLKAIRPMHPYDYEGYFAHYEMAEKLGMPMMFHTGFVSKADKGMLAAGVSTNPSHMKPAYLMGVAAAFPTLTLIAAHLGNPWWDETYQAIFNYPNLYADLSGGNVKLRLEWIDKYLHRKVGHKILLGIDATYGRECYHKDILYMIDFWEKYFDIALRISDVYAYKNDIFISNAQKIAAFHNFGNNV